MPKAKSAHAVRTCPCGKQFIPERRNQVYHDNRCRIRLEKRRKRARDGGMGQPGTGPLSKVGESRVCAGCGVTFTAKARGQSYHSAACRTKARNARSWQRGKAKAAAAAAVVEDTSGGNSGDVVRKAVAAEVLTSIMACPKCGSSMRAGDECGRCFGTGNCSGMATYAPLKEHLLAR
jgi:hypothetical protein